MTRRSKVVDQESFLRASEMAESAEEAASNLGMQLSTFRQRAHKYRQLGIPVKEFRRKPRVDVQAAKQLLAELRGVSVDNL